MCSLFFFFKQKTAYEVRISDWSSDVCSSDLPVHLRRRRRDPLPQGDRPPHDPRSQVMRSAKDFFRPLAVGAPEPLREIPFPPSRMIHFFDPSNEKMAAKVPDLAKKVDILLGNLEDAIKRSEEHTSELQSLMTIS